MKRASYREGVAWIALNDNAGEEPSSDPTSAERVESYISTSLLADLFGVTNERVAKDVMRYREKEGI